MNVDADLSGNGHQRGIMGGQPRVTQGGLGGVLGGQKFKNLE